MKLISVVAFVLAASMILPEASGYYLRCSTFDGYKRDVSRAFSYRDSRINSMNSYAAAINRKVCAVYTIVRNFNSAHVKMEAAIKKQSSINAQLARDISYLYNENKELEALVAKIRIGVASAQKKNNDQDAQINSLKSHNSKQDSRLAGQENVNADQQNQISSIRSVNSAQESRLSDVRSVNKRQDDSFNMLRSKNNAQDGALDANIARNAEQDKAINHANNRNAAQNAALEKIVSENEEQAKKIKTIQTTIDNMRQLTINLVNKLLAEFSSTMHKSVFAKDMFLVMLNSYI